MKVIPVEPSEVSASVSAGVAGETGYRLGALCAVLCLSVCVRACACLKESVRMSHSVKSAAVNIQSFAQIY